jgi:hypothetical protein
MRRMIICMLVGGMVLLFAGCGDGGSTTTTSGSSMITEQSPTTSSPSTTGAALTTPTTAAGSTATSATAISSSTTLVGAAAPDPKLHSAKDGTPESKAILDALRVPVEQKLGQKVLFVVDGVTVQDGFAFVAGRPVQPSGADIDYADTPYAEQVQAGAFDDAVYALLRWTGGSWKVLVYNIGATDVAWSPWAAEYGAPAAIFPGLEK